MILSFLLDMVKGLIDIVLMLVPKLEFLNMDLEPYLKFIENIFQSIAYFVPLGPLFVIATFGLLIMNIEVIWAFILRILKFLPFVK